MSTRKLIAVALLCGLAILVAGGIQLFRIFRAEETFAPGVVGDRIVVDGVTARVAAADLSDGRIALVVDMTGPEDRPEGTGVPDTAAAWTVSIGETRLAPLGVDEASQPPACPSGPLLPGETLTCSLAFDGGTGSPFARFTVGDVTGVWALKP